MSTRENTREANMQERIQAGLHPKMGSRSLAEDRRVLMTWSKAELIEFYLREESDAIKASDRAIQAEMSLREHRAEAVSVGKPPKHPGWGYDKARAFAWKVWVTPRKGRDLAAETVFSAGWEAYRAVEDNALYNLRAYLAKTADNIAGTDHPWAVTDVQAFITDALTLEDDDTEGVDHD